MWWELGQFATLRHQGGRRPFIGSRRGRCTQTHRCLSADHRGCRLLPYWGGEGGVYRVLLWCRPQKVQIPAALRAWLRRAAGLHGLKALLELRC